MKSTYSRSLVLIWLISSLLFGCGSKELSRAEAQKLIEAGSDFNQPFALPLMQGVIGSGGQGKLAISEAVVETPAQAVERKIRLYYEIYPQIAVADKLGLVEPQVTALQTEQPKKESWMDEPAWFFDEKYLATDKAKTLWKDYDLPASENSLLLARKQLLEITGITKQGADAAQAQFTWKYVPNETARYFDASSQEFKTLPADIQQRLLGRQPPTIDNRNPQNATLNFPPDARKGQASFRRYDDGWRLETAAFQ